MIDQIVEKYTNFILNLNPSKSWKITRFFLHWITLPIKLILMGFWSIYLHIYMLRWKNRPIESKMSFEERKQAFLKIYNNLPIYKTNDIQLHVNRVPYDAEITGDNHNDDHQLARHGVYGFLLSKLHKRTPQVDKAIGLHFTDNDTNIARGFKIDSTGKITHNPYDVSGDQLISLTLYMLDDHSRETRDKFIKMVEQIIDNDYALKSVDGLKKSKVSMWQPGLEPVGAQALTILSALKVAGNLGSAKAKKEYRKLMWLYGYGLLSLIPTTWSLQNRNYSNDNNCISAAHVMCKQSHGLAKLYWFMIMLYVWSLSYKWCNGYYTGLVQDIYPIFSKKYIKRCKDYLYEEVPNDYSKSVFWRKWIDGKIYPVKFNEMSSGEFWPDEVHQSRKVDQLTKSGLGWVATAIMIDQKEAREFIKN